jgi:HlyD family secretion protein
MKEIIDPIDISEEELKNINLRSDEVNEILGQVPDKIVRYGITIVVMILFLALTFSFCFKHPDIIYGNFYMQSANAPAFLLARSTGKLQSLLVEDKDKVTKGQLLATIENSTSFLAYKRLNRIVKDTAVFSGYTLPNISGLGELQVIYANYKKAYQELIIFHQIQYHKIKINSLKQQKQELIQNIKLQELQVNFSRKQMELSKNMFKRDSLLFVDKTIAALVYEQSQQTLLEQEMSLTNNRIQLSGSKNSLSSLVQQILELKLNFTQEQNNLQVNLESAFNQLVGSLNEWEDKYCLKSPISGKVSFSGIWEVNQNIKNGQLVMSVLPKTTSRIIAKVIIPIGRAGKVKPGQEVNLKLYDFPYREFGIVISELHSISEVPDSAYVGTIFLSDSLITNHHRHLPFKQNMQGIAEIITEDLSLAERLFFPIRDIFK